MSEYTNPQYLYLHSSIATQKQVYDYTQNCISKLEEFLGVSLNREIHVNTVTKYDGTPLKHSYIWLKSPEVAYLLLNKNMDGTERTEEIEDPTHDTTEAEQELEEFMNSDDHTILSWAEAADKEDELVAKTVKRKIKKQKQPLVSFGNIEMTSEQKEKYPNMNHIEITFYHVKASTRFGFSNTKLIANFVPKDVTEQDIRIHLERYCTEKKDQRDKKNYPLVHIERKSNPSNVLVTYPPGTNDALFACLMVKRLAVSEKCVLNFDLYREN
jgi:hypothetical protein